jgi:hypothetical protein
MSSSFVIWFFALAFVASSVMYIFLSKFVNEFILVVNPLISDGMMTAIFVQNFNFTTSVFTAIPLISFFSLVIWGFVKIIEEKQAGM